MTPAELRELLETRAREAEAIGATAPVSGTLRWVLELLGDVAGPRTSQHPAREPERLLTADELAVRMGVTRQYCYRHAVAWPFTRRIGGKLRFSERAFEEWCRCQ